jgi:hypothetical protein
MVAGTSNQPLDRAIRWETSAQFAPSVCSVGDLVAGSFQKELSMRQLIGPLLFLMAATPAWPRVAVVFRLASAPLPVQAGQEFALCAANVGTANADITLNFVNVRTGAIVASKQVTLPPPGAGGAVPTAMPDPCLTTTADAIVKAGAATNGDSPLIVALMVVRHGVFRGASAATASVQVTVAGPNGGRQIVASIPLYLATMTNGRNTPIEIVL